MNALNLGLSGVVVAETEPAQFSQDTWLITLIKALVIVLYLIVSVIMALWVERRGLGRMQTRPGPNVHGPLGLFQSFGDAIKMLTKEDMWKSNVDKALYVLGPTISAMCAFLVFAVIPLGPNVTIGNVTTALQLTDTPVAVLFMLAVTALGVYGIVLGGWASNATLTLLGSTRSAAQIISYELGMGLALLSVFIMSGSMSTSEIVSSQTPVWWCVALFPSFVIYIISMLGEVNRLPFDMPECEGELVAGYQTEYSSMKFGWYYLAEYVNMFNVSAICTTLFLGGWRFPFGDVILGGALHAYGLPVLWFTIKLWTVFFFMVWVRGTLLRVRYDQLMKIGWKGLIPIALVWVVIVAIMRTFSIYQVLSANQMIMGILVVFLIALLIIWLQGAATDRKLAAELQAKEEAKKQPFDAFAGGFPVPPLPGQQLPPSPRSGKVASKEPALIGGTESVSDENDGDEGGAA